MPVGFRIASAWVDIRAEDKGLRQQIKEIVEKAARGQDAKIQLKIDSKGLRREVEDALKEATKGQKPKVEIAIKSTGLRKEVSDALKRATDNQKPRVKLSINSAGLRREVQNALNEATKDQKPTVRLGISSVGLRSEVQRALREATAGEHGDVTVNVRVDGNRLRRALADTHPDITPNVDVRGLRQSLMSALRRINVNEDIHINPNIDGDLLRRQIQSEVGRLRDRFRVRITPDVDTDTFAARLREAARGVAGRNEDIPVDLNPRINELKLRAEAAAAAARLRQNINFNGDLNVAMTRAKLMASLAAARAGMHITIPVRYDNKQLRSMFGDIEQGFRAIEGPTGRWSKIIQAGALGALPAFAALDHAIRSTGPSLAVLVTMASALTVGVTAFAVGFNHMGAVISGIFGGSKTAINQLGDNLDQLSPKARAFADELMNIKGGFTQLRIDVQDQLFNNMDQTLADFTTSTLPVLRRGLAMSAMGLNAMAKGAVDSIDSMSRMGTLDAMFGGLKIAMDPIVKVPGQFLNAWVKTTIAATPLLTRMNTSFGNWATNMSRKLDSAFSSGRMTMAINKAGDTIVNFFRRIANNPEFTKFLDRMKSNGPEMAKTFGDIATALMKVVNALAPISGVVMKVVDAFAKFIDKIPTIFLEAFIIKLFVFKTALGVSALIKNVVTALGALKMSLIALQGPSSMAAALGPRLAALGMSGAKIRSVAAALGLFSKAGLAIGGLLFTFQTISWAIDKLFGDGRIHANMEKLNTDLVLAGRNGKLTGEAARVFGKDFGELGKAIGEIAHPGVWDRINHGFKRMGEAIGINGDDWQKVRDRVKTADEALAGFVKDGNLSSASMLLDRMSKAAGKNGTSTAKLLSILPKYKQALADSKAAQQLASLTMGAYGSEAMKTQKILDENRQAVDGLRQSIEALNDVNRGAATAEIGFHEAISTATDTIKSNMKGVKNLNAGLDVTTKKGQENRRALIEIANSTSQFAQATLNATGSYTKANRIYEEGRGQLIKLAEAAGASTTEAKKMADQWLKMPKMDVAIDADVSKLDRKIKDAQAKVDQLKQKRKTAVGADKTKLDAEIRKAQAEVDSLKQKKAVALSAATTVFDNDIAAAQRKLDSLKQKRKTAVGADKTKLDSQIAAAQRKVDSLRQKKAATLLVKDLVTRGVASAQDMIDSMHGKTVTVNVKINGKVVGVDPSQYYSQGPHKGSRYGGPIRRAYGGPIPAMGGGGVFGPGGPTSDLIHAMLSNGEFVIRAAAVKKYGMNFLSMLNRGALPKMGYAAGGMVKKYAGGGLAGGGVASGTLANALVKITANTTDIDGKLRKTSAALSKIKAPKAISIKASDNTQKATNSAKNAFKGIPTAANSSYKKTELNTTNFGNHLAGQFNSLKGKNATVWKSIGTSLQNSISSAYAKVKSATSTFGTGTISAITNIKTKTGAQWSALGTSMLSRTNKMYSSIKGATGSFGTQEVAKFKQIASATGSAWGTLGPKFKPPVSYLIHTVLNSGMVGAMNAMMSKLGGGKRVSGVSVAGFARGGPIYGEGTSTSDSIPARLSNGEYVIQAAAVKKFGVGFFHQVNRGSMPGQGAGYKPGFATGGLVNIRMAPGFAAGGSVPSSDTLNKILGDGGAAGSKRMTDFIMNNYVLPLIDSGPGGSAMKDVQRAGMNHIRSNVEAFVKDNFGGAGSAAAGLRWAKTQYGKKYQWGGNGNPSWDCSGFMSAIESVIRGEKPHRRWATGAFGSSGPPGWKRNANAPFKIGITNAGVGHTAGTIGKENVESSGGIGVHGGVGVPRGWNDPMFTSRWGYVGPNATKKASGGYISGPGGPTADRVPAMLSNGEYVIRAAAVNKLGTSYLNALNSGRIRGFASGGSISGSSYTVKSGDTLSQIASRAHTTVSQLMSLNKNIKDANKIYAGQTIILKKVASNTGKSSSSSSSSKVATAPKGDIQDASAVSSLKNSATLREAQDIANHYGAKFKQEVLGSISGQSSLEDLVSNLTSVRSQIYDSFQGKTQDVLAAKFTATANKLIPLQMELDKTSASLETAQGSLDDLKGKFDSMKDSVSGAIKDFANVTKIGQYGTSGATLLAQMQKDADKAKQFNDMLTQLKAKGVNGDVIGQIANAGLSGGGIATAQTILNMTPEQLAQLNSLETQINSAADNAGSVAASGMYQAGINAAEGLVKGLQAQQSAIEAQMLAIATAMQDAIRQALGIKSPSRVMMKVADFTIDGLRNQLVARTPEVAKAMDNLVGTPTAKVPDFVSPGSGTGTIDRGSRTIVRIDNVVINVDGGQMNLSTPADRRALAKTIVKEMKEEIRKDDRIHK